MIQRSTENNITTLRLAHGKASALDLELVEGLALAFNEVAVDENTRAVVLTGSGSIISAGVDLYRLTNEGAPYVERFLPALNRMALDLFALPKPVVVAVNGHAIAGGCVITLAGDLKVMARGRGRIGVPEMLVGVPFPPQILEILRFALPAHILQQLIYTGRTVSADEAAAMGIVDEAVDEDALLERAMAHASQLAALHPRTFALAKRELRDKATTYAKRYGAELGDDVRDLWSAEATHAHIRGYLDKTVGRK